MTLIFKKGDRRKVVHYRPVSITSVCCKLLEHIVCSHIHAHLDKYNILTPMQHGFRKRHSCESQLIITLHDLMSYFDKKITVDVAILDLSKAFDTVPHDKLLHEISHYGVNEDLHCWISNVLTSRHQRVVVNGEHSDNIYVASGVPPGDRSRSTASFTLHKRPTICRQISGTLFADDCLIYRPIMDSRDQYLLDQDLAALSQWADTWGMKYKPHTCL